MKEIKTRFKKETIPYIDVLFRASEKDSDVDKMMEKVSSYYMYNLNVTDSKNNACVIHADDIYRITVKGKQVHIRTADAEYYSKETLKKFEKRLDVNSFVRVSRNEIVNIGKIRKYDFSLRGTLRIELSDGTDTWASRRSIPTIRKLLSGKE